MRVNAASVIVALLLLLLAAGGGYWLYRNIEFYEEARPEKPSARALRDPYLAADRFLAGLGAEVRRDTLAAQLKTLPADGAVILSTPSSLLVPQHAQALLRWVESGGALLMVAGNSRGERADPLLDAVGVRRIFSPLDNTDDNDDDERAADANTHHDDETDSAESRRKKLSDELHELNRRIDAGLPAKTKDADEILTAVQFAGREPLQIRFTDEYELVPAGNAANITTPEPVYTAQADDRTHLLRYTLGGGELTVVSDIDFIASRHIGEHDHALALQQWLGARTRVSLIADVDMPPLPRLLWQWAREIFIALAVVLLAGLWRIAQRFGPIADRPVKTRRALAEHIGASARYLWRNGESELLLAELRRGVQHRAQTLFAEYATLDGDAQVTLLHARTTLERSAIHRALFVAPGRDHNQFRNAVQTLQQLSRQLHDSA